MQYYDEVEKLKYMRDRIASSMVAAEMLPDRIAIDKRLQDVDAKLALFQHIDVKEGTAFDVERFNLDFMAIYQDLLILYKLTYEASVKRFNDTKAYIDTHLAQLEAYADRYSRKAEFESGGVATGKTIFFQGNGFSPQTSGFYTILDLGNVEVSKGSKVTFHIDGRNFDIDDTVFSLGDMRCKAYKVSHDYVEIPGEAKYNLLHYELPEDIVRNATFPIQMPNFTPAINNRYIIYGGRDKITNVYTSQEYFYEKDKEQPITPNERRGRVSFYVIGATYIDMDFTHERLSQNFAGTSIPAPQNHQLVTFEYDAENFSFNVNTDGIVYAVCRRGVVKDDVLYYPQADPELYDFRIEEYGDNDKISMPLQVKIKQLYSSEPYVEMVAVKEQALLDEVQV